jgi:formiminotetrahydrofolate cyclodeaminase
MFEKKPLMDEIGQKAQTLLKRLIFLIDEDTKAFNDVLYANRISVKSEEEKGIKKLAIENANKYAIQIPLETAELCLEVIKLSDQLIDNGNKNSVTDSSVAAEVGLAGLRGACMNVLINIKEVEDKNFAKEKTNLVYHLIKTGELLRKTVFDKTLKIIKK